MSGSVIIVMNEGMSNQERIKVDFTQINDIETFNKMTECAIAQYNAKADAAIAKTTTDKVAAKNAKVSSDKASDIMATSKASFTFTLKGTTTVVTAAIVN